jgi:hypothetical protein
VRVAVGFGVVCWLCVGFHGVVHKKNENSYVSGAVGVLSMNQRPTTTDNILGYNPSQQNKRSIRCLNLILR